MLDKANKGHDFVFPPEVKAYIVSHFRMIREENLKLNQSLEATESQLNEVKAQNKELKESGENVKAIKSQLEREKAKNKAMMKRLKNDANDDIIWIQKDQNKNLVERPPSSTESRPASTALPNNATKAGTDERKIKMLNKALKSLRLDNSSLKKENDNMRQVK